MNDESRREALLLRRHALTTELEQIEATRDAQDEPSERELTLRAELEEIDFQLDPTLAERRRHSGRADADVD